MASEEDVRAAHRRGSEEGYVAAIAEVRTFTGVQGIEPSLDQPEHVAYPNYLRALQESYTRVLWAIESSDRDIARLNERLDDVAEEQEQLLDERQSARAERNVLVRAIGSIGDKNLPVTRAVRDIEQRLEGEEGLLAKRQQIALELREEATRVDRWIATMIEHVEAIKAEREAEEEHRRQVAEWEARDASPRWCSVYSLEAFIDEDERRQARGWDRSESLVVGGADFGYRWHRDADAGPDAEGGWSLHVILETKETILEYRQQNQPNTIWLLGNAIESMDEAMKVFPPIEPRQRERNSVALVLDTYAEYASKKAITSA